LCVSAAPRLGFSIGTDIGSELDLGSALSIGTDLSSELNLVSALSIGTDLGSELDIGSALCVSVVHKLRLKALART
jgi:hypothetical protein